MIAPEQMEELSSMAVMKKITANGNWFLAASFPPDWKLVKNLTKNTNFNFLPAILPYRPMIDDAILVSKAPQATNNAKDKQRSFPIWLNITIKSVKQSGRPPREWNRFKWLPSKSWTRYCFNLNGVHLSLTCWDKIARNAFVLPTNNHCWFSRNERRTESKHKTSDFQGSDENYLIWLWLQ